MAKFTDDHKITFDTDEFFEKGVKANISIAKRTLSEIQAGQREIKETSVKVGKKVATDVKTDAARLQAETCKHNDENTDRILRAFDDANGVIAGWKILVALILAALAGWGTYVASKGYIVKDVMDAAGNVIGQAPYMPYIILLVVLAVVAAFFVVAAILSSIGRRR